MENLSEHIDRNFGILDQASSPIFGGPGMLKLEFSANTVSQPAKDNVTRDYTPNSAPSGEPVTRDTPNNSKWYSIHQGGTGIRARNPGWGG